MDPLILGVRPDGMPDAQWAAVCTMQQALERMLDDADLPPGTSWQINRCDDGSFDVTCSDAGRATFLRQRFKAAADTYAAAGFHTPYAYAWEKAGNVADMKGSQP